MNTDIKFLLIEDDEDDHMLIRDLISDTYNGEFAMDWKQTWEEGQAAIKINDYDVCLVDYRLGQRNGLELIREEVAGGYTVPMILLTGAESREIDLEAMEAGACDYLIKGQITGALLERSIRYAIERQKSSDRLASLAMNDTLTGVANRNMFQLKLNDALAQHKRTEFFIALILLDIDYFKRINDTYGHQAGDAVLTTVAKRLAVVTRDTDTVARLGGDEFAIIATNIQLPDGGSIIAQKIIDALCEPIIYKGQEISVSTSIGITMCPPDKGPVEQLMTNADVALYQAKNAGRGRYQFFDEEMNEKRLAHQKLLHELNNAINKDEFVLYFQPKIRITSGQMIGAEALIRWEHPDRGLVPPNDFIPATESSGMILDLGRWVLREACLQSAAWRDAGFGELPIAVNISVSELKQANFVETVEQIIADTQIDPRCLEIEITETMVMDNVEFTVDLLYRLRKLGIWISMDDFGTGHSSLARLKHLPIDTIKIDRSLIANILDDPRDIAITKAIITLADNLGLNTVAEGVETEHQLSCLRSIGCGEAQGYFFGRPVHAKEFNIIDLLGEAKLAI